MDKRMKWKAEYIKNRPLINSILMGIFYFLFCWSTRLGYPSTNLFIGFMLFLPGLTFPFTTCYYKTKHSNYSYSRGMIHLVFSIGIYHGSVWLYSDEGRLKFAPILAGFLGALLFLIITKYLLKKGITWTQIAISSVLSGLAFLPHVLSTKQVLFIGLSILLWTVINGFTLNRQYKEDAKR